MTSPTFASIKVTDILKNVKHSCDGYILSQPQGWLDMMYKKLADPESATLIRLIEENGFTDPIGIIIQDDGAWVLGNGHHRLSVAILLGLDEVLVGFGLGWPEIDKKTQVKRKVTQDDRETAAWLKSQVEEMEIPILQTTSQKGRA